MARKLEKKAAPSAAAKSAAEDLSALQPNVTISVADRKVTIREYGFWEGLEVAHKAAGFIADLVIPCASGSLTFAQVRRLFGSHKDVIVAISAQAADVDADWVLSLEKKPADAELFLSTWFAVNTGFFMREVVAEIREAKQRAAMRPTGSDSSPASPRPDSATSTGSADSPSGS